MSDKTVWVVLDPHYGQRLERLNTEPKWVIDSPENRRVWETMRPFHDNSAIFEATASDTGLAILVSALARRVLLHTLRHSYLNVSAGSRRQT